MKKVLIMLAFAGLAIAANAQSKFVLGGQLGFNHTCGSNHMEVNSTPAIDATIPGVFDVDSYLSYGTYNMDPNTTTIALLPKIGYQLNDKMQVGAHLGWIFSKTKTFSTPLNYVMYADQDYEGWVTRSQSVFVLAPYFRYNLTEFGKFTLFCEAELTFGFAPNAKVHYYESAYKDVAGINHPEVDEDAEGYELKTTTIDLSITPGLNYKFNDKFSADIYIDLLRLGFNHTAYKEVTETTTTTQELSSSTNNFYFSANADAKTISNHFDFFRIGFNYHF